LFVVSTQSNHPEAMHGLQGQRVWALLRVRILQPGTPRSQIHAPFVRHRSDESFGCTGRPTARGEGWSRFIGRQWR